MHNGFNFHLDSLETCDLEDNSESAASTYTMMFLITGITVAMYGLVRYAESKNQLNYESRFTRITAGFLMLLTRMMHSKSTDLVINNPENTLIAIGPHRTGWEAIVVASKIKGTPVSFFATDFFNSVPGVSFIMKMFKTIPVVATKNENGQSARAKALQDASKILSENGCVGVFPQGNFSKIGQEPHRIYTGVAKLALMNNIPIHVIRLDGFWCLQNPLIPIVIRNSVYYRAFFSAFHMNNIHTTLCCVIDFHLKPENEHLSDEEKIDEICAELYAYYRHTEELNPKQINTIKTEISNNTHNLIWHNKVQQDNISKQLLSLKEDQAQLEEQTSISMRNC